MFSSDNDDTSSVIFSIGGAIFFVTNNAVVVHNKKLTTAFFHNMKVVLDWKTYVVFNVALFLALFKQEFIYILHLVLPVVRLNQKYLDISNIHLFH